MPTPAKLVEYEYAEQYPARAAAAATTSDGRCATPPFRNFCVKKWRQEVSTNFLAPQAGDESTPEPAQKPASTHNNNQYTKN